MQRLKGQESCQPKRVLWDGGVGGGNPHFCSPASITPPKKQADRCIAAAGDAQCSCSEQHPLPERASSSQHRGWSQGIPASQNPCTHVHGEHTDIANNCETERIAVLFLLRAERDAQTALGRHLWQPKSPPGWRSWGEAPSGTRWRAAVACRTSVGGTLHPSCHPGHVFPPQILIPGGSWLQKSLHFCLKEKG